MNTEYSDLFEQFEAHTLNPAVFGHLEHIQVAWEMLHKYDFLEASSRYANAINTIATKAGAPEKFHMTITLAFLSLIAERLFASQNSDFDEFMQNNRDLLSKNILGRWYPDEQLNSELARTHFVLPETASHP